MQNSSSSVCAVVTIRKDKQKDRYINYEEFKQIINFLWTYKKGKYQYSKLMMFLVHLGFTGFRPGHVGKAKIDWLLFKDRQNPKLGVVDTKHVPKKVNLPGQENKYVMIQYEDWDERKIPLWVRDLFEEYIRRQWMTFANGNLYPGQDGRPMKTEVWDQLAAKLRVMMYKHDPIKYEWVNEVVSEQFNGIDKRTNEPRPLRKIRKLSLYSFRKGNITWYVQKLLENCITDVPFHAAQYAGHSPRGQHHIYRYVKRLLAENMNGGMELIKPPNLNENFLGVENPASEIDKYVSALVNHPELRALISKFVKEKE